MRIRSTIAIVLLSVMGTLGMVELTGSVPVLGTSIFRFDEVEVDTTEVGFSREYISNATSTLVNLELRAVTLDPGASPHPPRPHQQSAEQLILVKDGTLEVELGEVAETTAGGAEEGTHRLEPGAVLFLAPNQWHALRNASDEPVTYYVIDWVSPGMMGEK
ncbi:MAG: cupin domain-containing protein [Rhodothermales bacterium]